MDPKENIEEDNVRNKRTRTFHKKFPELEKVNGKCWITFRTYRRLDMVDDSKDEFD